MSIKLACLECKRIPEYDAAVLSSSVTLEQIVDARYKLHQGCSSSEEDSLACYQELLWLAYQHAHGPIVEYYFSAEGKDAVVLTKPDNSHKTMSLDLFYPIDRLSKLTPDFESTLWTCISQFQTIAELDLKFKGQDAIFLELYLLVIYVFVVVEAQQVNHQKQELEVPNVPTPNGPVVPGHDTAGPPQDSAGERIKTALTYANGHLRSLYDKVDQFSRREAQAVYVKGMFFGIISVLALVAGYVGLILHIGAANHWTSASRLLWHLFAIAVTSGAVGAVVSVMLRVSNHPLQISYNAGRRLIWLAGYFRPIVGAIFGLVFYVLISAGMLQVLVAPHEIGSRAFFIAAVCFAAGFSERLAQDIVVRALPSEKGTESGADISPARRPEEAESLDSRNPAASPRASGST